MRTSTQSENARTIVQNWLDTNNFSSLVQHTETIYTVQDVRNLQNFLLAKPAEENLAGKPYDLNHNGIWNVFDLCLMKQKLLNQVDAVSSATADGKN